MRNDALWVATIALLACDQGVPSGAAAGLDAGTIPIEATPLVAPSFGHGEPFADIRGIAVGRTGYVYVLGRSPNEVRVFDTSGVVVTRWGREGAGPGEFLDPIGISISDSGRVWVVDQGTSRFSVFDPQGRFLTSFPRLFSGHNVGRWKGALTLSGQIIDVVERPGRLHKTVLYRFGEGATAGADSYPLPMREIPGFVLANGKSWTRANIPFAPRDQWVLDPAGYLWSGVSDRYVIAKTSFSGDTVHLAQRDAKPTPVGERERARAIAALDWFTKLGGQVDPARIPRSKPLFQELAVDDEGRLWVMRDHNYSETVAVFDVYDSTGVFLAALGGELGRVIMPPVIRGGQLYAVAADSDGVYTVMRSAIPALQRASP